MIGNLFALIELILRLIGLWDSFLNYIDKKKIAAIEKNREDRNAAVDDQKGAKDEAQFDKDQDTIIKHLP